MSSTPCHPRYPTQAVREIPHWGPRLSPVAGVPNFRGRIGLAITIGTIVIDPGIGVGTGGARDSVRYLADNDWLMITVEGGRTSITFGSRARKLLEDAAAA
jgi:hypothetical protein